MRRTALLTCAFALFAALAGCSTGISGTPGGFHRVRSDLHSVDSVQIVHGIAVDVREHRYPH